MIQIRKLFRVMTLRQNFPRYIKVVTTIYVYLYVLNSIERNDKKYVLPNT